MYKILYAKSVYDNKEINAVSSFLKKNNGILTNNKNVKKLEGKLAKIYKKNYCLLVNSGSVANEIAVQSLSFNMNDEVITPCLTFGTTISPIIKNNLKPILVDIEKDTLNINSKLIEKKITNKTKCLMIPNLIGNLGNFKEIYSIAKKHNLKVIEDSADTIYFHKSKNKSDIITTSFYGSHIITLMGIGGAILTDDKDIFNKCTLIREWGRSSSIYTNKSIENRFSKIIDGYRYDNMFLFEELGTNSLVAEANAVFGLEQLKRLKSFSRIRKRNFTLISSFIEKYFNDLFIVPSQKYSKDNIWLAFPLILKNDNPKLRNKLQIFLENKKIQTRVIFTGNVTKQPAFKKYFKKNENFPNTDHIMRNGLLIGLHQSIKIIDIKYFYKCIKEFFNEN
jgi:CDP-6-deoxy-D-xylo-4-hexulose-3-dehydrase